MVAKVQKKRKLPLPPPLNNVNVVKNDARIWSAAQMRASFPHKKPKCVHHLQPEDAP